MMNFWRDGHKGDFVSCWGSCWGPRIPWARRRWVKVKRIFQKRIREDLGLVLVRAGQTQYISTSFFGPERNKHL